MVIRRDGLNDISNPRLFGDAPPISVPMSPTRIRGSRSGPGRGGFVRQIDRPATAAERAAYVSNMGPVIQRRAQQADYEAGRPSSLQQSRELAAAGQRAVEGVYGEGDQQTLDPLTAALIGMLKQSRSGSDSGSGRTVLYDPDPESTRSQALIDAIASGYGSMREAEQTYLDALLGQIGGQRTAAQERSQAAADAAQRTIAGLTAAAGQSGQAVGQAYSQAQQQVADLIGQYAAEQAARQQGAQQTLGMFGAPAELAVPGGVTPMDYLAAQQAAMGRFGAAEQAYYGGAPTRYGALGADYARQRDIALQQQLDELAAQEAARQAEFQRNVANFGIQEAQAIAAQQQAEWERQAQYPRAV